MVEIIKGEYGHELRLTRWEKDHPELVLQRLFRTGKYLDFENADYPPILFEDKVRRLLNSYVDNVDEFGQDAVAHLCLGWQVFRGGDPTIDVEDEEGEFFPQRDNSTISGLRGLLAELDSKPKMRVLFGQRDLTDYYRTMVRRRIKQ